MSGFKLQESCREDVFSSPLSFSPGRGRRSGHLLLRVLHADLHPCRARRAPGAHLSLTDICEPELRCGPHHAGTSSSRTQGAAPFATIASEPSSTSSPADSILHRGSPRSDREHYVSKHTAKGSACFPYRSESLRRRRSCPQRDDHQIPSVGIWGLRPV